VRVEQRQEAHSRVELLRHLERNRPAEATPSLPIDRAGEEANPASISMPHCPRAAATRVSATSPGLVSFAARGASSTIRSTIDLGRASSAPATSGGLTTLVASCGGGNETEAASGTNDSSQVGPSIPELL
jgi:hypothetical protein